MKSRWFTSPPGIAALLAAVTYAVFLLIPGETWWVRPASAVDWIGGAVIIVGPVWVGGAAWNVITTRKLLLNTGWGAASSGRVSVVTLVRMLRIAVSVHLIAVAVALAISLFLGARGPTIPSNIFRQLVAVAACVALGQIIGLLAPWKLTPPVAAIAAFLSPWVIYGNPNLNQVIVDAGGASALPMGPEPVLRVFAAQIALWGAIVGIAFLWNVMERRIRTGVAPVLLICFAVVGAAGGIACFTGSDTAFQSSQYLTVDCVGEKPQVCLGVETSIAKGRLTGFAEQMESVMSDLGVDTSRYFQRVIQTAESGNESTGGGNRSGIPVIDGKPLTSPQTGDRLVFLENEICAVAGQLP